MAERNMGMYTSVATLSDPNNLTCSYDVAVRSGICKEIVGFVSFERAIKAVKVGKVASALVPCAYRSIVNFIMDSEVRSDATFIMPICPIVLASCRVDMPRAASTVYLHPSLEPLVKVAGLDCKRRKFVTMNPAASRLVKAKQGNSVALTNIISAEFYGLTIHKIVRPMIYMPWIVFVNKGEGNA